MAVDYTTLFLEDSMGNFTRPGGAPAPVTTTIAGINALALAGTLVVGTVYVVTDWTSGAGSLSGANKVYATAITPSLISGFVQVRTPLGDVGPSDGEFYWAAGLMTVLRDPLGNVLKDLGSGLIDAFPWGNANWRDNLLTNVTFVGGYAATHAAALAGLAFNQNVLDGSSSIDLTGCTGGQMQKNTVQGNLHVTAGAAHALATGNEIGGGGTLTVVNGVTAVANRVFAGTLNTNNFAATNVIIDGAFTDTLTAANSNTIHNGLGTTVV